MARIKNNKTLTENRKARHDYFVEEGMEAGIALVGTEVKSIRNGRVNLKDSYAEINNGEVFVKNMHISPYEQGNIFNVEPLRDRKLLLHKSEIRRLIGLTMQEGYTLIPLSLYLKDGRVKVNLGLCRGKKNYDKRDAMIEKAHKREIERTLKEKMRY
ncbi:SsrA-binding protein SmpB [Clostridium fallax]|uniref:SsrA-binding protein n=1 Tax=Clostridium fallax TaxID=1533 RepID=A0A1M4SMG9_9CLOT|nr:SsrA-binding protein SmpB [Clostridium fallax]SHE33352.1 SsrA-binding protein [Clostridium fallax]SQB07891.1 SsrA-binding protein [Clostridium fallax]